MLVKKKELANTDKKAICKSVLESLIKVSWARPDCWAPGEAQPRCPGIRGLGEVLTAFWVFIPRIETVPEILIYLPVSATVKEKPLHLPGELSSLSHITAHIENEIVYTARWGS